MNSNERGREFEEYVFDMISMELQSRRLLLLPSECKLHLRKGYHSRDRNSDIIVDVSIEAYLPGEKHWSMLWVWECKDYSTPIPVDDIEEFYAKLQQIAGANVKGGIATRGTLQRGALEYARSKGLAVFRFLPNDKISYIISADGRGLGSGTFTEERALRAFSDDSFRGDGFEHIGLYDKGLFFEWTTLMGTEILTVLREYTDSVHNHSQSQRQYTDKTHDLLLARAKLASQFSEYSEALSCADQIIRHRPNSHEALLLRSESLLALGDHSAAAIAADEARYAGADKKSTDKFRRLAFNALDRDGIARHFIEIGSRLESRGEIENALREYRVASSIDTGLIEPRERIASLLESLGKLQEAGFEYEAILQHDPGNRNAQLQINRLAGQGKME